MNPVHETVSRLRVRYAETDQMGVVYHAHYLVWCEVGRTDFLRQFGTSYARLEEQGLRLAVAEAQVRYLAAARYDDQIRVLTRLERIQSRALSFQYEIFREQDDGRVRLAVAHIKLVALDTAGAPCTLPTALLEQLRGVVPASA